ncbi:winged helix-turn-helix domain-containing protein [Photobacterium minamisatsumaniensis]|uniref:winged helix-turn-helix domain-containing protein n=1 Tax=Photobacterium minamisatsumaniensis TaxID=2910233 RepID=UPI003D146CFE
MCDLDLMTPITLEHFIVDPQHQTITRIKDGHSVKLSQSECLVVSLLASTPNQAISRDKLLEHCWAGKVVTNSSLTVAIKHIRTAFSELGADDIIVTEPKKGYLLRTPSEFCSISSPTISDENTSPEQELRRNEEVKEKSSIFKSKSAITRPLLSHSVTIIFFFITLFTLYQSALFVEVEKVGNHRVYTDGLSLPPFVVNTINELPNQNVKIIAYPLGGLCKNYQLFTFDTKGFNDITDSIEQGDCSD